MSCYKHLWTMILIIISNLAYASNIAWYAHDGQFHKLSGQINQAVWIDKDNVKLITRPDQNAESIPNNLKMRQRFYVVHQNFNIDYKGKHWMLLADYDQKGPQAHKLIGWIAHEDVLLNYTPLQSNSDFLQKVVLREGDVSNHQQANDVSVYHDPKLHGSSERLPIRTIFYVYKYAPKNGPIEDATSLLISPAPYLETTKESETLIAGWIARDKVTFWNTRSAIEFKPGYTYQLTLKTGEVLPLILDRALQHHEFRYPLLKSEKDSYTVGVFSTQSLQDLLPTFNLGLEVMFVIDATRSMQMGIDAVLKATQQIAKKIRRQSKETGLIAPKFGVVFYRDKATSYRSYGPGKQYKYCRHEVSMPQALTADISAFKDALRSQKACDANETPS
ncbi:MAG: hypothetical protein KAH77_11855, partial [Thiomargarita sp.]|nr:hypothetical protein [Thiomargarita sp.]